MSSREARGGTELQRASSDRGRVDEAEDLAPPGIEPAELAPARLSLGWRLGILVSLVIVVVAGGIRFFQEQRIVERDRTDLQAMLLDGLIPLAHEIGMDPSLPAILDSLRRHHRYHSRPGQPHHRLELRDAAGNLVAMVPDRYQVHRSLELRATVPVRSRHLAGGQGTLRIWQDGRALAELTARRWRSWAVNILVVIGCVLFFLLGTIHLLVLRPLGRLLTSVRLMERGYWGDVQIPGGAREIRYLAWRFRRLTTELEDTTRRLLHAERRAAIDQPTPAGSAPLSHPDVATPAWGTPTDEEGLRLWENCRVLEAASERSAEARTLAEAVWTQDAIVAEQRGDIALKSRLENAALRLLEPQGFAALEAELKRAGEAQAEWAERTGAALHAALGEARVETLGFFFRVKHVAGVYRKMRLKQIALELVHDLFAFRVVVPEEVDCYVALGAVHRAFSPQLFRFKDYIAAPKPNGYQGLHTSVQGPSGPVFEVQIRSRAMHEQAEAGVAAHWRYKIEQALARLPAAPPRVSRGRSVLARRDRT